MDLIYQFQETGVGCADHQDPSCLCDVRIGPPIPIKTLPRYAQYPSDGTSEAFRFILWASMTLGRFEALEGINETELNEALGLWEGRDATSNSHAAAQKVSAASKCLRAGLNLEQTARWLSTELPLIMDLFWPRSKHELVLKVEKLIREGKTAKQVVEEIPEVTPGWVTNLARRWNVTIPHSGMRYGPEVKAQVREMVKSGKSRRAVGRELGISESRVASWCKDLPCRKYVRRNQNG